MANSRGASSATSSRPLRLLVAGLGAFGKEHLTRLTERSDVNVVGVADANPAALEPIRAKLGVAECLTDPLQLIEMVEADAIIVATPAVSHVEIGVRALAKNLPVLLEKPVAPSAGDTLRQASALGCVTRSVEAYAILIGWVIPTIKDHRLLRLRAIKLMAWAEARKTAAGYEAGFSLSDVAHASELCPGEDLLSEAELQALYPPSSSPVGSEASDGPPTEKSKTQIPARVGRKKIHENTASKQKAYRTRKKALRNTPETMQNA